MTNPSETPDPLAALRERIAELERSLDEKGAELRQTRVEIALLKNEVWRASQARALAAVAPPASLAPRAAAPPAKAPPAAAPSPAPPPHARDAPPPPAPFPAPPQAAEERKVEVKPLPASGPRPLDAPSRAPGMDLETRIGTLWLRRVGLVVLVIGVVLFGRLVHRNLEPWHKVTACYALAAALVGIGVFLEKRVEGFGRALTAGGLAIGFFTSYAARFFPPMACMGLLPSLALMSISVFAILYVAERWRSEPAAMLAIFLGHAASFVASGEADVFSVVAILFLSAAGVALFIRHDWLPLNLFSVIAAFASHFIWSLRATPAGTPESQLRVQLIFLTSYYGLFLASDVIHKVRLARSGRGQLSPAALASGRALGPCSLVLYATLAATYFHATAVHWDSIHLWLFPLAALQAALVLFHLRIRNEDWPFHAAAAAAFATLGLFSAFDGLSLNLMLAAEALLLLVLARRLRLWFLAPLAQAVLLVNFVHYWKEEAGRIGGWPEYLGLLTTSLVYFVKSRMEWGWTPAESSAPEGPLAARLRTAFDRIARPLAWPHALLGATIAVSATAGFADDVWTSPLLSALAVLAVAAIIGLRHEPMIIAVVVFELAAAASLFHVRIQPEPLLDAWAPSQAAAAGFAIASLALMARARIRGRAADFLGATASFAAAFFPAALASLVDGPKPSVFVLWILPPVAYWAGAFMAAPPSRDEAPFTSRPAVVSRWAAALAGTCGSILFAHAAWRTLGRPDVAVLLGAAATPVLLALVLWTGWARLLPALIAHLAATTALLVNGLLSSSDHRPGEPLAWAVLAGAAVTAAALIVRGRARPSFALGGVAALVEALVTSWILIDLAGQGTTLLVPEIDRSLAAGLDFDPIAPWLLAAPLFWIAIEALRALSFAGTASSWSDLHARRILGRRRTASCVLLGIAATAVLLGFTARRFDAHADIAAAAASYALVFLILAAARRSAPLATAAGGALAAAYALFLAIHGELGPAGALLHPSSGAFVTLVGLLAGALSECAWRGGGAAGTPADTATGILAWSPYACSLLLGGWLSGEWGSALLESHAMEYPGRAAFWLVAVAAGRLFSLPWLALAGLAFALGQGALFAAEAVAEPIPPEGLLHSAIALAAAIVAMERLLRRDRPLDAMWGSITAAARLLAVAVSATVLLAAITNAVELEGSWTTFGWSLVALGYAGFGFLWRETAYRLTGLVVFGITLVRVILVDLAGLELFYRMLAFLGLGASLLIVSFLYSRSRSKAGMRP